MSAFARCECAALLLWVACTSVHALQGTVLDSASGKTIAGATVVAAGQVARSDATGHFELDAANAAVSARASGYRRSQAIAATGHDTLLRIALAPCRPKALYLSVYGIGSATLRDAALKLIDDTELDALVIDVKGDRGLVPYRSAAVTAGDGVPQTLVTVHDMPALVASLHARGLYLIARVVVFKDDPHAQAHPEWAVHDARGALWRDREGLAWIDPFHRAAWARSLAIAEEAAQLGFDEVQFDYLRFPDASGLVFSEENTHERRVAAIDGFLEAAQTRLAPYNVFLSADVFGYVAWNQDDTHIGQQLEMLAQRVDYLSPMLYPSGFTFGIPGHRNPVTAPYAIVDETLRRLLQRTRMPALHVRPWLQAFRDYAFDRRLFDADEIRAQIDAAERLGTDGWMLWNAANRYEAGGLEPERAAAGGAPAAPEP